MNISTKTIEPRRWIFITLEFRYLSQKSSIDLVLTTNNGCIYCLSHTGWDSWISVWSIGFQQLWSNLRPAHIFLCPSLINEEHLTSRRANGCLCLSIPLFPFPFNLVSWWCHPLLSSQYFSTFLLCSVPQWLLFPLLNSLNLSVDPCRKPVGHLSYIV